MFFGGVVLCFVEWRTYCLLEDVRCEVGLLGIFTFIKRKMAFILFSLLGGKVEDYG